MGRDGTKLALLSREREARGLPAGYALSKIAVKSARPELSPANGKLAREWPTQMGCGHSV